MEWWVILIFILCATLLLFLIGLPVAFSFMLVNIIGFYIFGGGEAGLRQLVLSMYTSVTKFTLLPLPLFIIDLFFFL